MAKKAVLKVVEGKTDEAITGFFKIPFKRRRGGGDCHPQGSSFTGWIRTNTHP